MNANDVQNLFNYNYWATDRVLAAATGISAEEYVTNMPGLSFGSLQATLVHMLAAEHIWRRRCFEGVSPTTLLDEDDAPTLQELRNLWTAEERLMRESLAGLIDKALHQPIHDLSTEGNPHQEILWRI